MPCGDLGIIDVHAPNSPIDRRNVWEAIKEEVSRDCFWLFCGDLNMAEGKEDKSSFCWKLIFDKKKAFMASLKICP